MKDSQDWAGVQLLNGQYRVERMLSRGGMATVWLARDEKNSRAVVIKAPKSFLLEEPGYAARFRREINSLICLSHLNITPILDVGEHEGTPFAVMAYLAGGNLRDRISAGPAKADSRGAPNPTLWLASISAALDFCHENRCLHRDLKPENILFSQEGEAFLSDFGIAKLFDPQGQGRNTVATLAGVILGTPAYMAPEWVQGKPIDGRCDQYGLAVTVFEALTGQLPIDAPTPAALLVAQSTQPPLALSRFWPDAPSPMVQCLHRALAKDPNSRFKNCRDFASELLAHLPHSMPSIQTQPATVKSVSCPRCGTTVALDTSDDRHRCPGCGVTLRGKKSDQTKKRVAASVSPPNREPMEAQEKPTSHNIVWLVGGIVIGLLVLIVVLQMSILYRPQGDIAPRDTSVAEDGLKSMKGLPTEVDPKKKVPSLDPLKKPDRDGKMPEVVPPPIETKKAEFPEAKGPPEKAKVAEKKGIDGPKLEAIAVAEPDKATVRAIGQYQGDEGKDTVVCLQEAAPGEWKRLTNRDPEVITGRPLLSLPGSWTSIYIAHGFRLTLCGNMPEILGQNIPLYECKLVLHDHDRLGLDITLVKGQFLLTNLKDKPMQVRVRFANPFGPDRLEHYEVLLHNKGTQMLFGLTSALLDGEPFYPDRSDARRRGPVNTVACMVVKGFASVNFGDVTHGRGPLNLFQWNALAGPNGPTEMKDANFALQEFPISEGVDEKSKSFIKSSRDAMKKARSFLAFQLEKRESIPVTLAEVLASTDPRKPLDPKAPTWSRSALGRLTIRSMGALGRPTDINSILDVLDPPSNDETRRAARETLLDWLAADRENDYVLYGLLEEKYRKVQANRIMDLMHGLSKRDVSDPTKYEELIDLLDNSNPIVRELAAFRLYQAVPMGRGIPYSAWDTSDLRRAAMAQWRVLVPSGSLPATLKKKG